MNCSQRALPARLHPPIGWCHSHSASPTHQTRALTHSASPETQCTSMRHAGGTGLSNSQTPPQHQSRIPLRRRHTTAGYTAKKQAGFRRASKPVSPELGPTSRCSKPDQKRVQTARGLQGAQARASPKAVSVFKGSHLRAIEMLFLHTRARTFIIAPSRDN